MLHERLDAVYSRIMVTPTEPDPAAQPPFWPPPPGWKPGDPPVTAPRVASVSSTSGALRAAAIVIGTIVAVLLVVAWILGGQQ